jgi:Flp pilus assembly protein TadG
MRAALRRNDRGMMSGFVAALATGLLFMTGLVYDGGRMINTYMEASNLASNAARAAAQAADTGELYRSGAVRLDLADAQARANAYLDQAGHHGQRTVTVNGDTATVTLTIGLRARILPIGTRTIRATASATAQRGVEQPSGAP